MIFVAHIGTYTLRYINATNDFILVCDTINKDEVQETSKVGEYGIILILSEPDLQTSDGVISRS